MEEEHRTGPTLPEHIRGPLFAAAGRWLVRVFAWHVRAFVVVNAALNAANALTGRPWWAFWPLLATGFLLAVHYLFYKAAIVDERWVDDRIEELNLKSYDRSHIEGLKVRHSGKDFPGMEQTIGREPGRGRRAAAALAQASAHLKGFLVKRNGGRN